MGCPKEEAPTFLITAPTDDILKKYTVPKFLEGLPNDSYVYKKAEGVIYFLDEDGKVDGSRVILKACYRPDNIESMTLDGVWADEAGQFRDEIHFKLLQRTSVRRGFIVYTTSLYSGNFIYNDFLLPWLQMGEEDKAKADFDIFTMKSLENPAFPIEDYYKAQKTLPPEVFERDYNANLIRSTGLIYPMIQSHIISMETVNPLFEKSPRRCFDVIIAGVDFAVATPCAVSVIGIKNGVYYVIDEFKRAGVEVVMGRRSSGITLSKVLKNFMSRYQIKHFYADPEDKSAIRSLRDEKLPIFKADKSVYEGLSKCRTLLVSGRLFIDGACTQTTQEMRQYSFELDKHGLSTDRPIKKNDHLMDAMRYAIYTHLYTPPTLTEPEVDIDNFTSADWIRIAREMQIPNNIKSKHKDDTKLPPDYSIFDDPFYH